MNGLALYQETASKCSRILTKEYSTSFFSAIKFLGAEIQEDIHAIYGMVRVADEIVDTFHDFNKAELLARFKQDTFKALDEKISLNPILHSFQATVNRYDIARELIEAFFKSMELDLDKSNYLNTQEYHDYVYGSAEVVGLMCLTIFCKGDKVQYDGLKIYARALGAAFQKINFLRDIRSDIDDLNRQYFPGFSMGTFNAESKKSIEEEIEKDFALAFEGIKKLPLKARFGVYVAYRYYLALFNKVKKAEPAVVLNSRIRISNPIKMVIVLKAGLRHQLNIF